MNRKGQVGFYVLMIGLVIFLLALALAPGLNDTIQSNSVRGVDGLDCSNSSISNQDKAACTQTDLMTPLFIMVLLGIGGMTISRLAG